MSSLLWLRLKICAVACVLGAAVAFLAYTHRGLLILGLALVVALALGIGLRLVKPEWFMPQDDVATRRDVLGRLGTLRPGLDDEQTLAGRHWDSPPAV